MEVIDIVFACKRSRLKDAVFIHLYCRNIKQQKEKMTIKRTDILSKVEDKMPIASSDATIIMNIAEMVRVLAESKTNCNVLMLPDLIFERLSMNEKINGTAMIFINERIMFDLLDI